MKFVRCSQVITIPRIFCSLFRCESVGNAGVLGRIRFSLMSFKNNLNMQFIQVFRFAILENSTVLPVGSPGAVA